MEKKEIATEQIIGAAEHYKKSQFICAITLAGAAEEILGKIALKRTNSNEHDKENSYLKSVYEYFGFATPSRKFLSKKINLTNNELKHNDSGENIWVEADFENEAALLFIKAIKIIIIVTTASQKIKI